MSDNYFDVLQSNFGVKASRQTFYASVSGPEGGNREAFQCGRLPCGWGLMEPEDLQSIESCLRPKGLASSTGQGFTPPF